MTRRLHHRANRARHAIDVLECVGEPGAFFIAQRLGQCAVDEIRRAKTFEQRTIRRLLAEGDQIG